MKVITRMITFEDFNEINESEKANAFRQLRKPLLQAFDVYKSNIYYGIISETSKERSQVLTWYENLCDLKQSALTKIPEKIAKYL